MATHSKCAIHEADEEMVEEPYMVCFECGHVFNEAEDLVKAYEEMVEDLKKRDNEGGHFMPKYEAARIFFCPHCLHDF
jgi:heterodisulfide reductase subunit B